MGCLKQWLEGNHQEGHQFNLNQSREHFLICLKFDQFAICDWAFY